MTEGGTTDGGRFGGIGEGGGIGDGGRSGGAGGGGRPDGAAGGSRIMSPREQEVAHYVERVRAALADLPPRVRDELLEDLPEHLTEVAAEADGALTERLGPPEAYAAELRAAAGVAATRTAPTVDQRVATAVVTVRRRLREIDGRLGPVIGYARASDFLRLLRPAWWVLRGYLVAMVLAVFLSSQVGVLPRLGDSLVGGAMLLAGTVTGSIWLGRRSPGYRRWQKVALNVAAALLVLFGLGSLVDLDRSAGGRMYEPAAIDNAYSNVQDVYVYDRQGRLLRDVRLFDQNGQPIRLGYPWCAESQQTFAEQPWPTYPYCPGSAPFQFFAPGGGPGSPLASPTPAETASPSVSPPSVPAPTVSQPAQPGRGATPAPQPVSPTPTT
ncbi:hypothetical protein AB0J86_20300 [Micromonospora sp. NPDC049559]|uniref:HAAS signaling domain-containing protein n=1 Tax=Micromonospora sp. NPDC049559 TaxID=3155923 RepID=UPI00343F02F2